MTRRVLLYGSSWVKVPFFFDFSLKQKQKQNQNKKKKKILDHAIVLPFLSIFLEIVDASLHSDMNI